MSVFLPLTLNLCPPAETPQQVARHEVPPRLGPPGVRGGGASGPREGGLHRVGAVLREEGVCRSPCPPPSPTHPAPPRTTSDPNPTFTSRSAGTPSPGISIAVRSSRSAEQKVTPDSEPLDLIGPGSKRGGASMTSTQPPSVQVSHGRPPCFHTGTVQPVCRDELATCLTATVTQDIFSDPVQCEQRFSPKWDFTV